MMVVLWPSGCCFCDFVSARGKKNFSPRIAASQQIAPTTHHRHISINLPRSPHTYAISYSIQSINIYCTVVKVMAPGMHCKLQSTTTIESHKKLRANSLPHNNLHHPRLHRLSKPCQQRHLHPKAPSMRVCNHYLQISPQMSNKLKC